MYDVVSAVSDLRVLFVDDSEDERELFPLRFGDRFERVVTAGSVGEALGELVPGDTDVVFTDLVLADEDGFELVRRMRDTAPQVGASVPVVAVTGLGAADDVARAYTAGFSGYVVKPYESAELLSVVDGIASTVAALRRVRERCQASRREQRDLRERLVARREALVSQRLARAETNAPDTARRACVLASARRFAEEHFDGPVESLEISTTRLIDDGTASWIVIAICRQALLFVEVLDGPSAVFLAGRLDV